jgi:hypothetical protein
VNIPESEWHEAAGKLVQDERGGLWRIVGFIDRPTVILDPVVIVGENEDDRTRQTLIMDSPLSREFKRLVPQEAA